MKRRRRTDQEKLIDSLDALLRVVKSRKGRADLLRRLGEVAGKVRRKAKR